VPANDVVAAAVAAQDATVRAEAAVKIAATRVAVTAAKATPRIELTRPTNGSTES
jgi:hypothetical protein